MNQPIVGRDKEQKDNEEYSRNFARIPNMLFSSFEHLSKEEKYLYCTLKCVYWDGKGRYVSLRELGELTGYSVGALSKMLPRLHKCGLVNAEVRRQLDKDGREKGNPKYLISILDIWELNRYYHSCSPNERDLLDPSLNLVHENAQACSPNDTNPFTKSDKPVSFGEQVHAQVEHTKEKKDIIKTFRKKEGGEPSVTPNSLPTQETNSLSLSQKTSLLDQLTDEQADCWTRCQALTGAQNLTQKAYESVVALASKVTTTTDLQSLYDYAWERGEKIAKAQGRKADQPNVGTMVHFLPEWEQAQNRKRAEKEQEQAAHTHIAGTGKLTNWTQARMAGTLPPVNYEPPPTAKPAGGSGLSQVGNISSGLQERIRQARERRATQS